MNNKTSNEEVNNNQETNSEENRVELLKAVHHNGIVSLKRHFSEVQGQVLNLDAYGPVFVYHVKDDSNDVYSCVFFLRELVARFQSGKDPAIWMASFFIELMKNKGGKSLPKPASSEDEAKAIIDKVLVPKCIEEVRQEFAPEEVHAGLGWNQELGPIFEAGFPAIKEGNNVCAFPLHLLFTHLQLNRDPSELLLQGLYKIRKEHGMD
ncbi:hypothetical protein [Paenibacillus crassostreae]|uniref:Uncharacterized protein n=2 Tax=Paenibacillus crassostreae TaxID=1763538 RepID=A0A167DY50_9BACL|nr:hypothetical protein [Paenibacillus crassostreae]AOZ94540.1 hypothetical protein LPB68_02530 [Paenibacillus crassostreae]OAB74916.1 hypothetical protein PNBC_11430 [Paenibacillus crassostreae]